MINRLFGIMYILLNKETVTAKGLAEYFEVSVRTIYRDIEVLSQAGIPVYARKGKNGGICLMEQFVLNKMLITKEEQHQILAALLSVEETTASEEKEIFYQKSRNQKWQIKKYLQCRHILINKVNTVFGRQTHLKFIVF